ncbi:Benzyl alcohol O-benzoyltransferase [Hibiscus syriacus]|uniref:Benzyl alcohol O-benzoyltransferase n=1 Tax=Hibiscus syriacus TaxID=106335 RepID=A0A6A2Y4R0_HIBSY|nr:Benzyl alcohol O-benzoyltransferase [Hibiscus syriacus]
MSTYHYPISMTKNVFVFKLQSSDFINIIHPVKVIREALAQALVFYYPFTGRLREGPHHKLMVDCTGEGLLFIEADADVTLEQFGDTLQPPFPCLEEVLYDVPGSSGFINCPLLLIQVTRLRCGGFIFALRLNHIMSDAIGLTLYMSTVGEMARGWLAPSIPPVWERHLLSARDPPRITCKHLQSDEVVGTMFPNFDLTGRYFSLAPQKSQRFANLYHNTFDVVTEEYMKPLPDLMVIKDRPQLTLARVFAVSDLKHAGFGDIDFRWGKPVYGGMANISAASCFMPSKNNKGEDGILVTMRLPVHAMEIFVKELNDKLERKTINSSDRK